MPQRHPGAPAPGDVMVSHYPSCFGCGRDHPSGLHLQVRAGEGLRVGAHFEVTEHHQGAPGLAHGGVLAAAFDEALGALNWLLLAPAVTARLETDFREPVAVGARLHIDAEILGQSGRKVYTRAAGRLGGTAGPVVLTAAALFIRVDLEHFTTYGREEDVARATQARKAGVAGAGWLDVSP